MSLNVPEPVAAYLEAEQAKDADRLAACFAPGGVVRDEGREHNGRAAIAEWKREADQKYRFTVEPLAAEPRDGGVTRVRARVAGDFPGSPVQLRFDFTVVGNEIAELDVRP